MARGGALADRRNIEYKAVATLKFDPDNPRLPDDGSVDVTSDESILDFIERTYAVDELGRSLVDNGYFHAEPLLVVSEPGGRFRVVEGNRRLAALKLLIERKSRESLPASRRVTWEELAKQANASRLAQVPIIKYPRRSDLLDYLGFRHISGVKEWRPSAKARFLWNLMAGEKLDYRAAARRVGSTAPAVRRQVEAYAVLKQASERGLNAEPAERYFGLFYNALQDPGVRHYVGLRDIAALTKAVRNPVPVALRTNLGNLLDFLFGDGERRAVIRESREIRQLGKVLIHKSATKHLLERWDLDTAARLAGKDAESLETSLAEARVQLITANGEAFQWKGNRRIQVLARSVDEVMQEVLRNLGMKPVKQ